MDDAPRVCRGEGVCYFDAPFQKTWNRSGPPSTDLPQVLTIEQLHHKEWLSLVFIYFVNSCKYWDDSAQRPPALPVRSDGGFFHPLPCRGK